MGVIVGILGVKTLDTLDDGAYCLDHLSVAWILGPSRFQRSKSTQRDQHISMSITGLG